MRWIVLLAVVAGCGATSRRQPAPPIADRAAPLSTVERPQRIPVLVPPVFRMVRLSTAPTWPLVGPPSLEPHYRVASPWYAVCDRRGRLPDDTLAYVEAWCRYRRDSQFDLVRALLPLRSSAVYDLGDSVRRDVANMIADRRNGQGALVWLAAEANREDALYEHLIAVYTDLGQIDDATIVATEYRARGTPRCGRDLVDVTFAYSFDIFAWQVLFERARLHGVGSTCGLRFHRTACLVLAAANIASPMTGHRTDCDNLLDEDELASARAIAARMSARLRDPHALFQAAELAISALHVHDAEELALAILENVLAFSCSDVAAIQLAAAQIQRSDHAQARHDARRGALVTMTSERCTQRTKR